VILSDKYVAGFLDGDGSILIESNYVKRWLQNRLVLAFHQKELNSGVLDLLSQWIAGGLRDNRSGRRRGTVTHAARLRFTGQKAVDVLCRLKPYLVAKRVRANRLLRELGFVERAGTDSSPVYPARKWLAGYFDADSSRSRLIKMCLTALLARPMSSTRAIRLGQSPATSPISVVGRNPGANHVELIDLLLRMGNVSMSRISRKLGDGS
jgi:hypothetical protein